jgi:hypothetical protein
MRLKFMSKSRLTSRPGRVLNGLAFMSERGNFAG